MTHRTALPDHWVLTRLDELAEINPPRVVADLPSNACVDFVPMRCVCAELGGINLQEVRPFEEVTKGYTQFRAGDVLYAKITPCMENGKVAVVPRLNYDVGYGSTEFHVLRASAGVEAKWLAHFIAQHSRRRDARRNMTGSAGQLRVPLRWLGEQSIPLAPTAEQRRIVAKLDELLSDLDAGVAALERVKANLKRYRAAVLKAAVEGRLTEEWRAKNRPQETGAQLLKRILHERRRRWEADQLAAFAVARKQPPKNWRARFKEPSATRTGDVPALPVGWCW